MGSAVTVESTDINLFIPINEVLCHCTDFHETYNHSNIFGHLLFWNVSTLDDICEGSSNVYLHSLNKACFSLHLFREIQALWVTFCEDLLYQIHWKSKWGLVALNVIAAGPSPHIAPKMESAHMYLSDFVFLIISSIFKWKKYNFHVLFCSYISDMFIAFPLLLCPCAYFSSSFFIKSGVRLHYN